MNNHARTSALLIAAAAAASAVFYGCEQRIVSRKSRSTPAASADARRSATPIDELHKQAIVIDTHIDTPSHMLHGGLDIGKCHFDWHVDLPRMRIGGLDAAFFAIWVDPFRNPGEKSWQVAHAMLKKVHSEVRRLKDQAVFVTTAKGIRRTARTPRRAILLGLEGGHMLGKAPPETQLERLREFYRLGVRYMTVTWATGNDLGGASWDSTSDQGLTPLGVRAIREMNRMGMIVDVSHVSDPTFRDIMKVTKKPVIASHSAARKQCDHVRNLSDDMLRAVARNGGAVCVNFYAGFLDSRFNREKQRLDWQHRPDFEMIRARHKPRSPTEPRRLVDWMVWGYKKELYREIRPLVPVNRLVDHIAHVKRVAGIDHVCLGSDFDGMSAPPAGLDDVAELSTLTAALRRRGFSDNDIRKVLGLNILRVMEAQVGAINAR